MLQHHIMTEQEKEAASSWKYEERYRCYDLPPYNELKKRRISFGNPEKSRNFYSWHDGNGMIGFTHFWETEEAVFVGIGVRPDLCSRGYGRQILCEMTGILENMYPGKPLALEVRTWNLRAVRCYESAGFRIAGEAYQRETLTGTDFFYRMVYRGTFSGS